MRGLRLLPWLACAVLLCVAACTQRITDKFVFSPWKIERVDGEAKLETLNLAVEPGVELEAWLLWKDAPRTVLYFHREGECLFDQTPLINFFFRDVAANLLVVDYRGFGHSGGQPSEAGLYRDAAAAYQYLVEQRGVPPGTLVLYGEGLGAAVALELAGKQTVGGLVMESAYQSLEAVYAALGSFLVRVEFATDAKFDSESRISSYRGPLLVLAGPEGKCGLGEQTKALFEHSPSSNKRLLATEKCGRGIKHFTAEPERLRQTLQAFLESLPGK